MKCSLNIAKDSLDFLKVNFSRRMEKLIYEVDWVGKIRTRGR